MSSLGVKNYQGFKIKVYFITREIFYWFMTLLVLNLATFPVWNLCFWNRKIKIRTNIVCNLINAFEKPFAMPSFAPNVFETTTKCLHLHRPSDKN